MITREDVFAIMDRVSEGSPDIDRIVWRRAMSGALEAWGELFDLVIERTPDLDLVSGEAALRAIRESMRTMGGKLQ